MQLGPYHLAGRLVLAPMAGVTDRPYRLLCRHYGAALAVSEMVSAKPELQQDRKTLLRCDHQGEREPRAIQIVGADPQQMAAAASLNVARGAQIIDINMGCPAKKVCNVAAGSALMKDELLIGRILSSVVQAVAVPVTLKIRTGWDRANRNAVNVARIAEDCGIRALTVHGRSRACGFTGAAEYQTVASVKASVSIPVIANGDIDSPEKARQVLYETNADALMIGRAALGRPWLFTQIQAYLDSGQVLPEPDHEERVQVLLEHLSTLYQFYGDRAGVRIARKHIAWYSRSLTKLSPQGVQRIFQEETAAGQIGLIQNLLNPNLTDIAA